MPAVTQAGTNLWYMGLGGGAQVSLYVEGERASESEMVRERSKAGWNKQEGEGRSQTTGESVT